MFTLSVKTVGVLQTERRDNIQILLVNQGWLYVLITK